MISILAAFCALLFAVYYVCTFNHKYWKDRGIKYQEPFLFFGNYFEFFKSTKLLQDVIREIYAKFSDQPYVGTFFFHQPVLMVRSPELIKKILIKDFDKFMNRNVAANEKADPVAFHNLPSARDKTWRNLRAKLSPVFTSGKMKVMLPLMQEIGQELRNVIGENIGKNIEVKSLMRKYSVDIISSCAFGINSNCLKLNNTEILDMSRRLFDLNSTKRNFSIACFFFLHRFVDLFKLTFLDKTASTYFQNIFKETIAIRKEKNIIRNDFVDIMLALKEKETAEDDYKFDDIKMASQAIMFFSAGSDTTSNTLTFALFELAINQDIQDRLRMELTENFQDNNGFTYNSLLNMKYLDMVFKETLRKYPLAAFLERKTGANYTFEETGLTLEKDMAVHIPVTALHYDKEYFPNPDKFDPERFSDENKKLIIPYTYLPFGDGPRICLGERFAILNSKVAIATIIKDYIIQPSEKTVIPIQIEPKSLFLTNKGAVYLKVRKVNY